MQEAFREFQQVHNEYHDKLTDENEIDSSDTFFSEVQKNYVDTYRLAKDWLKSLDNEQKPTVSLTKSESNDERNQALQ